MSRRKQQKPMQLTDSEEEEESREDISEKESKFEQEDAAGVLVALSNISEMKSPEQHGPSTRKRTRKSAVTPLAEVKRVDPPRERPRGKKCTVCQVHVKNIYELREHMLNHNLHMCTKCMRYFKYKRSFENHRYFCQGVTTKNRTTRSRRSINISEVIGESEGSVVDDICDKQVATENGSSGDYSSDSVERVKDKPSQMDAVAVKECDTASTPDNVNTSEVSVKRRRGRPPGSTAKLSRPTLVPVPGCTPVSRKRSYRSLDMDLQNTSSKKSPDSKVPYFDFNVDVTSTTNTHSSCVVHSGNLTSTRGSSSSGSACCHMPFSSQIFMPSPIMSPFPNTKESTFIWQGIQIQEEKPLVSRMEGINPVTEQQYVLYKCCLCGNAFPGVALLAGHLMAHTRGTKEHGCQKCGAIFKWRSQLEVHEQVHQVMDNRLAPTTTSCMMFMNSLGMMGSSENLTNSTCHGPTQLLPTCGAFFPSNLSPATAQDSGVVSAAVTCSSMAGSSNSPETLAEGNCVKLSKTNGHQAGRSASFQCKFCPKSFDRLFSLQRHERIHTGIKPCFCKICGKGFSERRNLRHHIIRFHSDSNQRDLFRRTRRSQMRVNNNSSHKLVSFLKRTAVRILNSMDQSRFDTEVNEQQTISDVTASHQHNNVTPHSAETLGIQAPSEDKQTTAETVMVVIPTDADQTSKQSSSHGSDEEQRELLQDPKRSLIGNRRKGRPFRLTNLQMDSIADEEKELEALCNGKLTSFSIENCIKEEPNMYLDTESGELMCPNMLQVTLTEDSLNEIDEESFSPESLPTFKAKLRGHGAFFSSYNPSTTTRAKELKVYKTNTSRLGVVVKPVIRTEACKPQVGPDGKCVYPCSYCFKTFCSTSDLNRHMDFHEDVRPFKCPYCSYFSRTNSQLKVHMMRHQGIKHFLCHICNYNGVTQSDLNRHCKTRTHLLRTRNICRCCGLGFYTRSLLEEHERMYNHSSDSDITDATVRIKEETTGQQDEEGHCENDDRNNNDCFFDSKQQENIPLTEVKDI